MREYYLLRGAVWRYLRDYPEVYAEVASGILRMESAISLASRAALIGFHRRELGRQGSWPASLERMINGAPIGLMPPGE